MASLTRDENSKVVMGGVDSVSSLPTDTTIDAVSKGLWTHIVALTSSIDGPSIPTVDSYTTISLTALADTANQEIVAAPGADKQIWIYGIVFTVGTADGTVSFQDEDDAAVSGVMEFSQTSGVNSPPMGNYSMPVWKVATNKALEVDTVTCSLAGWMAYAIVSV